MNITKYICANILSLFGNGILFLSLSIICLMGNYELSFTKNIIIQSFFKIIFKFSELLLNIYTDIVYCFLILCLIEILFHKFTRNKFILNIPFKNEKIKYTYNILFWIGITCSNLYLLFYLCFITR